MKYLFVVLLLIPLAIAYAETTELVPPLWQPNPANASTLGERYAAVIAGLVKVEVMHEQRDSRAPREAAALLAECQMIEQALDPADSKGLMLILRARYWLQMLAGKYTDAEKTADRLFRLSGQGKHARWATIARHRSGLPFGDGLYATDAVAALERASYLYSISQYEQVIATLDAAWAGFISEPHLWTESVKLSARASFALGKPVTALRVLCRAAGELRGDSRKSFIASVARLPEVNLHHGAALVWEKLKAGESISSLRMPEAPSALSFETRAWAAVVAGELSSGSQSLGSMLQVIARNGYYKLLIELHTLAMLGELSPAAFVFPFLETGDVGRACGALQSMPDDPHLPSVCASFLNECKVRGVDPWPYLRSLTLPPVAKAWFALESGDNESLNAAITALGDNPSGKGLAVLAMCAGMLKDGASRIPLDLPSLIKGMGDSAYARSWYPRFRAASVFRVALSQTASGVAGLDDVVAQATKMACAFDDAFALAVTRCTITGLVPSRARASTIALAELFASCEAREAAQWVHNLLEFHLSPLADEPSMLQLLRSVSDRAPNNSGLLILLSRAQISAGDWAAARATLTSAYAFADRRTRERIEKLLSSAELSGDESQDSVK